MASESLSVKEIVNAKHHWQPIDMYCLVMLPHQRDCIGMLLELYAEFVVYNLHYS